MSILYKLGRGFGNYKKGIQDAFNVSPTRPWIGDESAWTHPNAWGTGLTTGKPQTKAEYIAHFQSWVYIGVKLNAQTVASVPLKLYVTKPEGKQVRNFPTKSVSDETVKYLHSRADLKRYFTKSEEVEELTEHPFLDLMENVNPYHNSRDIKEFTTMYSDLTGESYWLIVDDELGIPGEIWPIPSQFINPKFGKTLDKPIISYVYKRGNTEVEIPTDKIIHFTYPNPHNIFTGFSCIQGIADAVYIRSEMDAFETALFENRGKIGNIFTLKKDAVIAPDALERLKQKVNQDHQGSRKAGKNMFLTVPFDFHKDAMTPEEMNFLDGRRWNMAEILAALDIPESTFLKDANKANSDTADYRHAKYGIKPRCERFAQKINEKLLPRYQQEGPVNIFCAFDNPVPKDKEGEQKQQESDLRSGATINEIRARRGEAEVEGGDEPMVDSRLIPLSRANNPTPQTPEQMIEQVQREMWDILN